MERQTAGEIDIQMVRQIDRKINRWKDRQMERQINGKID